MWTGFLLVHLSIDIAPLMSFKRLSSLASHALIEQTPVLLQFSALLQMKSPLHRIATCDGKWVFYDTPRRLSQWSDPSMSKLMMTAWWFAVRIIYFSFLHLAWEISWKLLNQPFPNLARLFYTWKCSVLSFYFLFFFYSPKSGGFLVENRTIDFDNQSFYEKCIFFKILLSDIIQLNLTTFFGSDVSVCNNFGHRKT